MQVSHGSVVGQLAPFQGPLMLHANHACPFATHNMPHACKCGATCFGLVRVEAVLQPRVLQPRVLQPAGSRAAAAVLAARRAAAHGQQNLGAHRCAVGATVGRPAQPLHRRWAGVGATWEPMDERARWADPAPMCSRAPPHPVMPQSLIARLTRRLTSRDVRSAGASHTRHHWCCPSSLRPAAGRAGCGIANAGEAAVPAAGGERPLASPACSGSSARSRLAAGSAQVSMPSAGQQEGMGMRRRALSATAGGAGQRRCTGGQQLPRRQSWQAPSRPCSPSAASRLPREGGRLQGLAVLARLVARAGPGRAPIRGWGVAGP